MALTVLLPVSAAWAHADPQPHAPPHLATAYSLDGILLVPLVAAVSLYAGGLARLWRGRIGAGVPVAQAVAFVAGVLVLVLALVWPLDAFGTWSLAAHMTQHMLLLALAPPLLLLGHPGAVWLAALPVSMARRLARPWREGPGAGAWKWLLLPTVAMGLQAVVMWSWHLPAAMAAALRHDVVHYAMHASFLIAGVLFWAALLRSLRDPARGAGSAAIAIVGTMMQMGLLSALLTFASEPLYQHYIEHVPHVGLAPLEDQQLAGLIMWVPAALPYVIGGLLLMASWLRRAERHDVRATRSAFPK